MASEPSLQERYAQAVRVDTGACFAAITEPDITPSARAPGAASGASALLGADAELV